MQASWLAVVIVCDVLTSRRMRNFNAHENRITWTRAALAILSVSKCVTQFGLPQGCSSIGSPADKREVIDLLSLGVPLLHVR